MKPETTWAIYEGALLLAIAIAAGSLFSLSLALWKAVDSLQRMSWVLRP